MRPAPRKRLEPRPYRASLGRTDAGTWLRAIRRTRRRLGAFISIALGRLVPDRVSGLHLTMPVASPRPGDLTADGGEKPMIERRGQFLMDGYGFGMIQSTRPQAPGYSLLDSPAGAAVGHYPGWEQPDRLVAELRTAFRPARAGHRVILRAAAGWPVGRAGGPPGGTRPRRRGRRFPTAGRTGTELMP